MYELLAWLLWLPAIEGLDIYRSNKHLTADQTAGYSITTALSAVQPAYFTAMS